jgi:hypothetical protein
MEAIHSSETSVHTRTALSYVPEDYNIPNYHCILLTYGQYSEQNEEAWALWRHYYPHFSIPALHANDRRISMCMESIWSLQLPS